MISFRRRGEAQEAQDPARSLLEDAEDQRRDREEDGGTFLSYWNSTGGSVCQNDVLGFYEVLQRIGPQKELLLFIKSDGGDGTASLRIVNLLRRYAGRLVAVLPLECASAATMVALGADEIQMGPLPFLTAVDTSLCKSRGYCCGLSHVCFRGRLPFSLPSSKRGYCGGPLP